MARAVKLSDETAAVRASPRDAVVVIGNFDGVHRGHRAVLDEARRTAKERGLEVAVLTFDPHPAAVVAGATPPLLTTLARKVDLLRDAGADQVYVRVFDASFAAWAPERFVRELVVDVLGAKVVSIGENFRFGKKRQGDLALLQKLGVELGFEARVHTIASDANGPYSSTRARMNIAAGDLRGAFEVLGRWHSLSGVVAHGQKLGRALGYPTANLEAVPEMLPADGIYAVVVDRLDDAAGEENARALAKGVMSIGVRPTLGGGLSRTVEAFLFDFDGDLYGARLRVHLVERLRDELRFDDLDALKRQMTRDEEEARAAVAGIGADEQRSNGPAFG